MSLELSASPEAYPVVLDTDRDRVGLIRLDEPAYDRASFLDERLLTGTEPAGWAPYAEAERLAATLHCECDFIFHTGHAGSTLLSRLLGASERVFSVREPAILRALAGSGQGAAGQAWSGAELAGRTTVFLRLWARVFRPPQRTLLKATSFVTEISDVLMAAVPGARAILMFTPPQVYIATILAGPASRAECVQLAPGRMARLRRRLAATPWTPSEMTPGELAALGWACEICALADTADRFATRVSWLDFEDFLARPRAGLAAVLQHLHGEVRPGEVEAILRDPDFGRYAKAPEYAYDPGLRRRVLDQAARDSRDELERGLAWLSAAGRAHPAIAHAVTLVARAPRPS